MFILFQFIQRLTNWQSHLDFYLYYISFVTEPTVNPLNNSIGTGKTIVEFFSAAIELNVCKYLNCRAAGDAIITSAASFNAREARCSPSAAIT